MSFIIRNLTGSGIALNDLGLTIPASSDYDLVGERPQGIATSTDLVAAIVAGDIVVLDPLDGTTPLSAAASQEIVEVHNDPHYTQDYRDTIPYLDTSGIWISNFVRP